MNEFPELKKVDKELLSSYDVKTMYYFLTKDFVFFGNNKYCSNFYKAIGLFNKIFVSHLFELDKDYALETVDKKLRNESDVELCLIDNVLLMYDEMLFELYSYIRESFNQSSVAHFIHSGSYVFKIILNCLEIDRSDEGVFIDLDLQEKKLKLYDYTQTSDKFLIIHDYDKDVDDPDCIPLVKESISYRKNFPLENYFKPYYTRGALTLADLEKVVSFIPTLNVTDFDIDNISKLSNVDKCGTRSTVSYESVFRELKNVPMETRIKNMDAIIYLEDKIISGYA